MWVLCLAVLATVSRAQTFPLSPTTPCNNVTLRNIANRYGGSDYDFSIFLQLIETAFNTAILDRGSGGPFYTLALPTNAAVNREMAMLNLPLTVLWNNFTMAAEVVYLHAVEPEDAADVRDFVTQEKTVPFATLPVQSELNTSVTYAFNGSANPAFSIEGPVNTARFQLGAWYQRTDCRLLLILGVDSMLVPPSLRAIARPAPPRRAPSVAPVAPTPAAPIAPAPPPPPPENTTTPSAPAPSSNNATALASTASPSGSSSNAGVIAGAVVGSVVGLAILGGVIAYLYRRRTRGAARCDVDAEDGVKGGKDMQTQGSVRLKGMDSNVTIPESSVIVKTHSGTTLSTSTTTMDPNTALTNQPQLVRIRNPHESTSMSSCAFNRPPSLTTTLVEDVLPANSVARYVSETHMVPETFLMVPDPPRVLGTGGFGEVYAAQLGDEWVAVKAVKGDAIHSHVELIARIESVLNEVKTLQRCQHENLVRCVGITNAWPFKMLYELCEGGDLFNRLSDNDAEELAWNNRGRYVALDIARGLRYLHESLNMVHSDIKSSNVLLTKDGMAKLGDFGLVRLLSHEHEVLHASKMICSQAYAAPEQLMFNQVSMAVDVFSCGVVLLELLVGRPVRTRVYPELTADETRPAEVVDLVHACLSEDPKDRPRIGQVYDVLSRYAT